MQKSRCKRIEEIVSHDKNKTKFRGILAETPAKSRDRTAPITAKYPQSSTRCNVHEEKEEELEDKKRVQHTAQHIEKVVSYQHTERTHKHEAKTRE